jgi:hypothetical protein
MKKLVPKKYKNMVKGTFFYKLKYIAKSHTKVKKRREAKKLDVLKKTFY